MTKEKLRSIADACFAVNPSHDLYYVTADGQCFKRWHDANEHSKGFEDRKIEEIRRDDAKKGTQTVDEKLEQIAGCATLEQLGNVKFGNKEHTSVVKAYQAKIKEFEDAKAKAEAQAKVDADAEQAAKDAQEKADKEQAAKEASEKAIATSDAAAAAKAAGKGNTKGSGK